MQKSIDYHYSALKHFVSGHAYLHFTAFVVHKLNALYICLDVVV